jgi:transposase
MPTAGCCVCAPETPRKHEAFSEDLLKVIVEAVGGGRPGRTAFEADVGQVVVMDNLPAHKDARLREPVQGRGCELLFLPYSPDPNPIEEASSNVKALLRNAEVRPRDALIEAMRRALNVLTVQEARCFFVH